MISANTKHEALLVEGGTLVPLLRQESQSFGRAYLPRDPERTTHF